MEINMDAQTTATNKSSNQSKSRPTTAWSSYITFGYIPERNLPGTDVGTLQRCLCTTIDCNSSHKSQAMGTSLGAQ